MLLRKVAFVLAVLLTAVLFASCSATNIDNSHRYEEGGDVIVPPDTSLDPGLNSNQRNIGTTNNLYQQNIVNRLYDEIGRDSRIADFDVDEVNIYILESKGQTGNIDYGNTVLLYGIENSAVVQEISCEGMKNCTAIAAKNGKLYAYDITAGSIFVFSSDGRFLEEIQSGLPGLSIEKMMITGQGRILFKTAGDTLTEDGVCVLDSISMEYYAINSSELTGELDYIEEQDGGLNAYIQDICLYDDQSLFIKVSPERLCLFNLESRTVENSSYMPDSARFITFDSGILYYASGLKIGLFNNNLANLSNEGSQDVMGRLMINDRFLWSSDPLSLVDFQLGEIIVPFQDQNYEHLKMRQNNKYIFLLDHETTWQEGGSGNGNHILRIAK